MKILIAPNSFKHSLNSFQVGKKIEEGFLKSNLKSQYEIFPIADGGNGTLELLVNKLNAELIYLEVQDPLGRHVNARFGYLKESETAVIEMAEASGIHLLKEDQKDPLHASSFGTGELMVAALNHGAKQIVLGLGGSATIDGGAGILQALGAELLNKNGEEIKKGGKALVDLHQIKIDKLHPQLNKCKVVLACDVNSPLLGPNGAARIFGPQKGASEKDVILLEKALQNLATVIKATFNHDIEYIQGGGAAGGISAGLSATINAEIVNGLEYLLEITNFKRQLKECNLVVTAEGKFDSQTLKGKGPFGVAKLAKSHGIPVIVFAGEVAQDVDLENEHMIIAALSISKGPVTLEDAIQMTGENLIYLAKQTGNILSVGQQLKVNL